MLKRKREKRAKKSALANAPSVPDTEPSQVDANTTDSQQEQKRVKRVGDALAKAPRVPGAKPQGKARINKTPTANKAPPRIKTDYSIKCAAILNKIEEKIGKLDMSDTKSFLQFHELAEKAKQAIKVSGRFSDPIVQLCSDKLHDLMHHKWNEGFNTIKNNMPDVDQKHVNSFVRASLNISDKHLKVSKVLKIKSIGEQKSAQSDPRSTSSGTMARASATRKGKEDSKSEQVEAPAPKVTK